MTLHLFVLMLFLLSSGLAKVVPDFEQECGDFFANRISPTRFNGPQYVQICQTLNNKYHYATYYDTVNRIPVYSAYKFEGRMDCDRLDKWYTEPQLEMNMASEGFVYGDRQALNGDYVNSGYHRGHLAPVYHAGSQSCADATFTLTNAAPQNPSFNSGQWRVLEGKTADVAKKCLDQKYSVYIVTGVVPGPTKIPKKIERVSVPSHFWTAYCCLDQNNKCQISRGFIGENKNIDPEEKTVNALNEELKNLYKVKLFEVFHESLSPPAKKPKI